MLRKIFKLSLPILVFIGGFLIALSFYSPKALAQTPACTTPDAVQNVEVVYPNCVGTQCNFTQAGCTWGTVASAANYNVVVTELETSTTIYNQQVPAATTNISFSITQGKTYKCDVSAVNSCGTAGPVGSFQLLCQTQAGVSPTSTTAPTIPPATPQPTIKPTGSVTSTLTVGFISVIFMIVGGAVLIL